MRVKRIALFSLGNIRNVGEDILADTTEWLIRRVLPDCEVVRGQFCQNGRGEDLVQRVINRASRVLLWLSDRTSGERSFRWRNLCFRTRNSRSFRKTVARADAVITAVGMFKFSSQDFSYLYSLLSHLASRHHIPLLISAASVAHADPLDWRSRQLARLLSAGGITCLSTRDGEEGVRRIREEYGAPSSLRVSPVGDPALWIPECYDVAAQPPSVRRIVGVNLVRGGIYGTYRGGFSEAGLLSFYGDLLAALDARGYEWRLFSNGTASDERFGDLLCERFQILPERRLPPSKSTIDYVNRVASFRMVFAARYHAFLTATALGVPSVALNWDDKFELTARAIGRERFLVSADKADGADVVALLEESERTPVDVDRVERLRFATVSSIREFLFRKPSV